MTARASVRRRPGAHPALPGIASDPGETYLERVPVTELDATFVGTQVLLVGPEPALGAEPVALAGGVSDVLRLEAGLHVLPCGRVLTVDRAQTLLFVRGAVVFLDDTESVLTVLPPAAALAAP